jgi:lactoylglutathione lyase
MALRSVGATRLHALNVVYVCQSVYHKMRLSPDIGRGAPDVRSCACAPAPYPACNRFMEGQKMTLQYLHTMVRVKDLDASVAFFALLGLEETKRFDREDGRYSLVFMAPPGQPDCPVELTYNWDGDEGLPSDGRHFGHLAYRVGNIYEVCQRFLDAGFVVNRPPRDGYMAFVRSPDNISVELLQEGERLAPAEPWASMENTGHW